MTTESVYSISVLLVSFYFLVHDIELLGSIIRLPPTYTTTDLL